jgi:hypothetical protein
MPNTLRLLSPPAYLAAAAANIYTPGEGSSLIFDILRHIHIANDTNAGATFTLCIGNSGNCTGGTELYNTFLVAANSVLDWFGAIKLVGNTSGNYLTGYCQTGGSNLTIMVEGESGVVA